MRFASQPAPSAGCITSRKHIGDTVSDTDRIVRRATATLVPIGRCANVPDGM